MSGRLSRPDLWCRALPAAERPTAERWNVLNQSAEEPQLWIVLWTACSRYTFHMCGRGKNPRGGAALIVPNNEQNRMQQDLCSWRRSSCFYRCLSNRVSACWVNLWSVMKKDCFYSPVMTKITVYLNNSNHFSFKFKIMSQPSESTRGVPKRTHPMNFTKYY